uniref:BTB domain-containing protein n=1 Tax=Macrostomum lignano TaxID=282301 RepID=A0A1I8JLN4_9PLAT
RRMEFVTLPINVWLDTEFFSADWTIVLNSQKAFRVNSKVLARYSRYFYKLFASAIRTAQPAMTAVTYSDPLDFSNLMAYLHYIDEHRDSERVPTETNAADDSMNEQFLGSLMQDADLLKRRLSLAKHFEIPFLIDAIVSTAIKKLSPYNCWMVMTTAVDPECNCKLLYDFAKDFILEHFVAATEQPQFVKLCSGEQLCELIDSKYLNVPAEIVIFDVICRWIETEQLDRSKYFCDLVHRMRHFMITDTQLQEMSAHHLAQTAEWQSILSTCSSLGIVEQYNPATGLWRPRQNMLVTRVAASAASLNGMVYVCMGAWHSSMEQYDCQNDQWTLLTATLPVELVGFSRSRVGLRRLHCSASACIIAQQC